MDKLDGQGGAMNRLATQDMNGVAEACLALLNEVGQMYVPYGKLVVEPLDKSNELVTRAKKVFDDSRKPGTLKKSVASSDDMVEFRSNTNVNNNFIILGGVLSELEKSTQYIERIDDLGDKLSKDPLFLKVATEGVKHGGLYVSGGSITRAMNGAYVNEERFVYHSDIDVISDCKIENFGGLAAALTESFSREDRYQVKYFEGSPPKISVVDKESGEDCINIVPAQYFADRAREVANLLSKDITTESDVETMLVYWTLDPKSQIALHFGDDLDHRIVNGGKPILKWNMESENELSFTNWQTVKLLYDKGQIQAADQLRRRLINNLARLPKAISKSERLLDVAVVASEYQTAKSSEVALAEFLEEKDPELKTRVRERAAKNLVDAINHNDPRVWRLAIHGFDGLFSPTLLEARGFFVDDRGKSFGDKSVSLSKDSESNVLKLCGLIDLTDQQLNDPALYDKNKDYCVSPTEFFALIAGLYQIDDKLLEKISEEIDSNWPNSPAKNSIFDNDKFLAWSREIRDVIKSSTSNFPNYDEKLGEVGANDLRSSHDIKDVSIVINKIRSTNFWTERAL